VANITKSYPSVGRSASKTGVGAPLADGVASALYFISANISLCACGWGAWLGEAPEFGELAFADVFCANSGDAQFLKNAFYRGALS
jgi:hypothetical protein